MLYISCYLAYNFIQTLSLMFCFDVFVFYASRGCIYLIINTVKPVILLNIFTKKYLAIA